MKLRSWHLVPSLHGKKMGKQWKQWQTFISLGSKITADGDCSHEMKRRLLLGRKPMTNLESVLKSRDITLPAKVRLVSAMVFPIVMFGCESWTIKKAECRRIDAFELWCWRRLLRVLWTARRSNLSILKEVSSEHSLEGLMLKLKFQNFGFLMRGVDWLIRKDFAAGKDWRHEEKGMTGWDGCMASQTPWTWLWANSGRYEGQGSLVCCSPWGHKEVGHDCDWTTNKGSWNCSYCKVIDVRWERTAFKVKGKGSGSSVHMFVLVVALIF